MSTTITALFDQRSDAEAAAQKLKDASIDASHIQLHDKDSAGFSEHAYSTQKDPGIWGKIKNAFMPDEDRHTYEEGVRRGGTLLAVDVDEDQTDEVLRVLESSNGVDLNDRSEQWRSSGWDHAPSAVGSGASPAMESDSLPAMGLGASPAVESDASQAVGSGHSPAMASDASQAVGSGASPAMESDAFRAVESEAARHPNGRTDANDEQIIPIVEEELLVGKRQVDRGSARVRSYVSEVPVHEQIRLRDERIQVTRRQVDQPLSEADGDAFRERTVEMTATGEEAVISKHAHVVEEVVISKTADERVHDINDTVRHTEVEIDNEPTVDTGVHTRTDHDLHQ